MNYVLSALECCSDVTEEKKNRSWDFPTIYSKRDFDN